MKIFKLIQLCFIGASIFIVPLANANKMLLDRMLIYFEPGEKPRQDIQVSNVGKDNLYLQTEIFQVLNPGADNEEQVRITDPDKMKLLTTPQKSVVKPGNQRTVRLINLETPKDKEAIYRVTFRPVAGDITTSQNAIQLLVAYQALIFIRPENPTFTIKAEREGNKITFTNTGNSNVIMRNGAQCVSQSSNAKCVDIESGGRIYAGQSLSLDLPGSGRFIKFGVFDGADEKQQFFEI